MAVEGLISSSLGSRVNGQEYCRDTSDLFLGCILKPELISWSFKHLANISKVANTQNKEREKNNNHKPL